MAAADHKRATTLKKPAAGRNGQATISTLREKSEVPTRMSTDYLKPVSFTPEIPFYTQSSPGMLLLV